MSYLIKNTLRLGNLLASLTLVSCLASASMAQSPSKKVAVRSLPPVAGSTVESSSPGADSNDKPVSHASSDQNQMEVTQVTPAGFMDQFQNATRRLGSRRNDCQNCSTSANGICESCVSGFPQPIYVSTPSQSPGLTTGACVACIKGVDCKNGCNGEQSWKDAKAIDFQPLLHGEFIGPIRLPAMLDYRIRAGDQLRFVYLLTREQLNDEYRFQVGDEIQIESVSDANISRGTLERGLTIQADGSVDLPLVGSIRAAGLTKAQLRQTLEESYKKYLKNPAVDVTRVKTNTKLTDLTNTVDARFGNGGLVQLVSVNPDGRINLPKIGSVYVYGLTLEEIKREVNLRYREEIIGVELEPILVQAAPHFVYVLGEVAQPGRFEMSQPTTVSQALALSGGIRVGGNHRQVVVFRRAEDWRLVSTMLDLRGAHLGRSPDPSDQIWLRDNDLIIVPPMPIKLFDNFVQQVFTQGIYGIVPFGGVSVNFGNNNGF